MKRIHRRLLTSSLLALVLSSCASPQSFLSAFQSPNTLLQAQSVPFARTARNQDWFAALRPELQQYYAPAQGKLGRDLMLALHQIIAKGQVAASYQDAKSFLYATADNNVVAKNPGVFDCYSWVHIAGTGGNGNIYKEQGDTNGDGTPGDFINAEHTWPQSFFNKQLPMVSDMHHIFPSLSKPNAMRNDFPLGMVEGQVVYTTNGGSKLSALDKTGKHTPTQTKEWFNMPWEQQPHAILDHDYKVTFEPLDRQKGNSARALLYFYLRYFDQSIRNGDYNEVEFWDSKVPTLIQWSMVDAPDELEFKRHEAIAKLQHNRNPFIDIPNLAQLIGPEPLIK